MTRSDIKEGKCSLRIEGADVDLLALPPLGHIQALILKTLVKLGCEASGTGVLDQVRQKTGIEIDHAQVYGTILKLEKFGFIEFVQTKRRSRRGAPQKLYRVTASGDAALETTLRHHQAVGHYLQD